jgi:hypothetical protein
MRSIQSSCWSLRFAHQTNEPISSKDVSTTVRSKPCRGNRAFIWGFLCRLISVTVLYITHECRDGLKEIDWSSRIVRGFDVRQMPGRKPNCRTVLLVLGTLHTGTKNSCAHFARMRRRDAEVFCKFVHSKLSGVTLRHRHLSSSEPQVHPLIPPNWTARQHTDTCRCLLETISCFLICVSLCVAHRPVGSSAEAPCQRRRSLRYP